MWWRNGEVQSAPMEEAVGQMRSAREGSLQPAACQLRQDCSAGSSSFRPRNANMQCSASVWQSCDTDGCSDGRTGESGDCAATAEDRPGSVCTADGELSNEDSARCRLASQSAAAGKGLGRLMAQRGGRDAKGAGVPGGGREAEGVIWGRV